MDVKKLNYKNMFSRIFIKIISSKFLNPAATVFCTIIFIFGYSFLKPFSEIDQVETILPLIKNSYIFFGIMAAAQTAEAIYPYGSNQALDKLFKGICILCTICAILFVFQEILGIGNLRVFFYISGIFCVIMGASFFAYSNIIDKRKRSKINEK